MVTLNKIKKEPVFSKINLHGDINVHLKIYKKYIFYQKSINDLKNSKVKFCAMRGFSI